MPTSVRLYILRTGDVSSIVTRGERSDSKFLSMQVMVSKGYFKTARGYVMYSPRAQPEVNKSRAHEVS